MYAEPIIITIIQNIKKAYYFYFKDYSYYFPITITFIVTVVLKKHNTCRLQSNVERPLLHFHKHIITDNIIIKLSWKFCGVLLSNRQSNRLLLANAPPFTITITITGSIWPNYYYYSGILRSLLLLLARHKHFITITVTIINSVTTPQTSTIMWQYISVATDGWVVTAGVSETWNVLS